MLIGAAIGIAGGAWGKEVATGIGIFVALIGVVILAMKPPPASRVIPLRYGTMMSGPRQLAGRWYHANGTPFAVEQVLRGEHQSGYGLIVINEGEPAYDVSIVENWPTIGAGQLKFSGKISRLTKEDSEALFQAWIDSPPVSPLATINGLLDAMRENAIHELRLTIQYKDGNGRWWGTPTVIKRDPSVGGLRVDFDPPKKRPRPPFPITP